MDIIKINDAIQALCRVLDIENAAGLGYSWGSDDQGRFVRGGWVCYRAEPAAVREAFEGLAIALGLSSDVCALRLERRPDAVWLWYDEVQRDGHGNPVCMASMDGVAVNTCQVMLPAGVILERNGATD